MTKPSDTCERNCDNCGLECSERGSAKERPHPESRVKKVIAVISGKGGVGKSMVTSLLAVDMKRREYEVAVLDADITGPSIPNIFGLKTKAEGSDLGIFPVKTKTGIKVMSINLLLDDVTDPVVWRGAMIGTAVKQFWTDVVWGDVDYMFIDMPPGTGDVALTVFQSLPVDGIIVVTSPQELVTMIVEKAVKMAGLLSIPIIGIIENYSYFHCPDNGKDYKIFGESRIEEIAEKYNIKVLARLPIDPSLARSGDTGMIELFHTEFLEKVTAEIEDGNEDI